MSIFDIFSSKPAQAANNPATPPATAADQNKAAPPAGNPTVPTDASPRADGTQPGLPKPPANNDPASPLANYQDLWQTPDTANNNHASPYPVFTADPQKLMEVAKRMDFAKIIPKDKATAALGGDAAAFGEVINAVVQASFAQSTQAATHLINEATRQQHEKFVNEVLPQEVRKHTVSEAVRADNPIFSNPAAAPLLAGLESQFRVKYPNATAAEISQHAKTYLAGFATEINGGASATGTATNKSGPVETDWEKLLLGPSASQ